MEMWTNNKIDAGFQADQKTGLLLPENMKSSWSNKELPVQQSTKDAVVAAIKPVNKPPRRRWIAIDSILFPPGWLFGK